MQKNSLSQQITIYIDQKRTLKLERFDKKAQGQRKKIANDQELTNFDKKIKEERASLEDNYQAENWITNAAKKAKQIKIVTHAVKYSHPDAKGTNIYCVKNASIPGYIDTSSLGQIPVDIVGNAAALEFARFLLLQKDGERLIDLINDEKTEELQTFSLSENQMEEWVDGFREALKTKTIEAHPLLKNVYFPVEPDYYHLLCPLFATSLAHAIYTKVEETLYKKGENKFLNLALQHFGGSNPQNISYLNAVRDGKIYLLNSAPPKWDTKKVSPPTFCFFNRNYNRKMWKKLRNFCEFIEKVGNFNNKKIREAIKNYLDYFIDTLFYFGVKIQKETKPSGWTLQSKLPLYQQLWLDPSRAEFDEKFRREREKNEWQEKIADKFSAWLVKELKKVITEVDKEEYQYIYKLIIKRQHVLKKFLTYQSKLKYKS